MSDAHFFCILFIYYLKGSALYAYNNATFTKKDWKGIRMLCDSIKVRDPMKVGRFGLGFKSVFHVTGKMLFLTLRAGSESTSTQLVLR